jgi:hypothetical protein
MFTKIEYAQMLEIESRVDGYRRMANHPKSTNDDRRHAISMCKEFERQLNEIQARVTYRKLMSA